MQTPTTSIILKAIETCKADEPLKNTQDKQTQGIRLWIYGNKIQAGLSGQGFLPVTCYAGLGTKNPKKKFQATADEITYAMLIVNSDWYIYSYVENESTKWW